MAEIDKKYHDLLLDILHNGYQYEDPNRKGTIRTEIQSHTLYHSFKDGFPAITTKKLAWKSVVGELLWFLRGDTNVKYLVNNNIPIWNKDAYNFFLKNTRNRFKMPQNIWEDEIRKSNYIGNTSQKAGDLGRIYGAQWRSWNASFEDYIGLDPEDGTFYNEIYLDQISNLIKGLKEIPMGTKHIVTAWNPAELNDMALPPCHWSFEILVKPIKIGSRMRLCNQDSLKKYIIDNIDTTETSRQVREEYMDNNNIPKYSFILKWHQRSVDTFLGLPFNIASYALLAHIIGKMTNMIPEGIIGDLSNVHIYDNHIDAVKEQLKRNPNKYDNCKLLMDPKAEKDFKFKKTIDLALDNVDIWQFQLKNYNSYPRIKAEMIPYTN